MIFTAHPPNQFESIVKDNKCASIICAEIIDRFREGELPELSAQEFHCLQLGLEFILHILYK